MTELFASVTLYEVVSPMSDIEERRWVHLIETPTPRLELVDWHKLGRIERLLWPKEVRLIFNGNGELVRVRVEQVDDKGLLEKWAGIDPSPVFGDRLKARPTEVGRGGE